MSYPVRHLGVEGGRVSYPVRHLGVEGVRVSYPVRHLGVEAGRVSYPVRHLGVEGGRVSIPFRKFSEADAASYFTINTRLQYSYTASAANSYFGCGCLNSFLYW